MEFRGVYLIWVLLPLWYFFFLSWVYLRPFFKVSGKEKLERYGSPFVYSSVCFAIAVGIDQFGVAEAFVDLLTSTGLFSGAIQPGILRFLIYPAVLVFGAQVQKFLTKEEEQKNSSLPKSKWSQ